MQLYNAESNEKKVYDVYGVMTVKALEDKRFAVIVLDKIYVYSYFGKVETVIDYRTLKFEDILAKVNYFYRDHCFYIFSKKSIIIIE